MYFHLFCQIYIFASGGCFTGSAVTMPWGGDWATVRLECEAFNYERAVYISHQRFRDPKIALLTDASQFEGPSGELQFDICTLPLMPEPPQPFYIRKRWAVMFRLFLYILPDS